MATNKMPECIHCFGRNWNLIVKLNEKTGLSLYQCGHGAAGAGAMNNGCSRVIAATEDQMNKGGII